jgi:hypothetical protein
MRKTLIALAATTGLLALGSVSASAAPLAPLHNPALAATDGSAIQKADWYCGPRCEYWRHRRWQEHRRWEEGRRLQQYGYNNGYYNRGYYGYR